MLKKLYEEGFLDYKSLLLKYYKNLEISERDLVVLIKILDIYPVSKKIKALKLSQETGIKKIEVEESLESLTEHKLISNVMVLNEKNINEIRMNIDSLFLRLADVFKSVELLKIEEGLKGLVSMLEQELLRPITPNEYAVVEDFITKDHFQIPEIEDAIKSAVKQGRMTLSNVEKILINNRKKALSDTPEEKSSVDAKKLGDALKFL